MIQVAAFRDAVGLGRKRSIQILEYFDRIGLTRRLGDKRQIRLDNALAQHRRALSSRKAIAPGGAAGLQTRLGTASVPGQVRLRLPSAIFRTSHHHRTAGGRGCVDSGVDVGSMCCIFTFFLKCCDAEHTDHVALLNHRLCWPYRFPTCFAVSKETSMVPTPLSEKSLTRSMLDVLIRAGLIVVLVLFCFEIFRPFRDLMLWSVILAITLYPLQLRLMGSFGRSEGRAATAIVLIAIAILVVPVYLLGTSIASSVGQVIDLVKEGTFNIPPPPDTVATWPLVGKTISSIWLQASTDLPDLIAKYLPQIKGVSVGLLTKIAGVGAGLLMFIVALIIAGIFMAHGEAGTVPR